jgi:hypothetical protein
VNERRKNTLDIAFNTTLLIEKNDDVLVIAVFDTNLHHRFSRFPSPSVFLNLVFTLHLSDGRIKQEATKMELLIWQLSNHSLCFEHEL